MPQSDESVVSAAMTCHDNVYRVPLPRDGSVSKGGRFASFHSSDGPDGIMVDAAGTKLVTHALLSTGLALGPSDEPLARIRSRHA